MSIAVCMPAQAPASTSERGASKEEPPGVQAAQTRASEGDVPRVGAGADDTPAAMRVVVIDDNQDSASALALLVELWGFDVRVGYDGYSALDLAHGFEPHAMLLDIGLPGFSGYETARRIRQAEAEARSGPSLLVAVTGYGSPDDVAQAIRCGFDHHLVKPSDPEVLERFLRRRAHRLAECCPGVDVLAKCPSSAIAASVDDVPRTMVGQSDI